MGVLLTVLLLAVALGVIGMLILSPIEPYNCCAAS
jgi:hypothetical protein